MRWWLIGIAAVFLVLVGRQPVLGAIDTATGGDTPTLREGLEQASAFINETMMAAERDTTITTWPQSADTSVADELDNNYSLTDRTDARRYPGYNDCDNWSNLVQDGWSASTGVVVTFETEQYLTQAVDQIQQHWSNQGHNVDRIIDERNGGDVSGLFLATSDVTYRLDINPRRLQLSIIGTTRCLPPG